MKKLMWAIIAIAFIVYCVVVYGWWQEGNRNWDKVQLNHDEKIQPENRQ